MATMKIEYIRNAAIVQIMDFDGTLDEATIAAADGLKTYQAVVARILDDETGEQLKAVVIS